MCVRVHRCMSHRDTVPRVSDLYGWDGGVVVSGGPLALGQLLRQHRKLFVRALMCMWVWRTKEGNTVVVL